MHPAMDGSMYIESNHLSFISYNDCNFCKAMLWRTTGCGDGAVQPVKAENDRKTLIFMR